MTDVVAPLSGTVWQHAVSVDQAVRRGDELLTLECMKMEVSVPTPVPGRVAWLLAMGEAVSEGQPVARVTTT